MQKLFIQKILIFITLIGCGSQVDNQIKNYKIFIDTDDKIIKNKVVELIGRLNRETGLKVLSAVNQKNLANSFIVFPKGISIKKGKIGFGSWSTLTTETKHMNLTDKTVEHSMTLEFDFDYFKKGATSDLQSLSDDLYLLWCHEVGHGLRLKHSKDRRSVMYKSVNAKRKPRYQEYYQSVREFFNN